MGKMTLEQAVRNAVEAEKAARRFYTLLAESTADEGAKMFLEGMAEQELCHVRSIESLAKQLEAGELPVRADENVELIETAPDWASLDHLTHEEALEMAVELESKAAMFYDALADSSEGKARQLFEEIAQQEQAHYEMLRERYGKG